MLVKRATLTLFFISTFLYCSAGNRDGSRVKPGAAKRSAVVVPVPDREPVHIRHDDVSGWTERLARERSARLAAENALVALRYDVLSYQRINNRITVFLAGVFPLLVVLLFRYHHRRKTLSSLPATEMSPQGNVLPHTVDRQHPAGMIA